MKKYTPIAISICLLGLLFSGLFVFKGTISNGSNLTALPTQSDIAPKMRAAMQPMTMANHAENTAATGQQHIIHTAYLSIQVKDVAIAMTDITHLTIQLAGLVVSSSLAHQDATMQRGSITIKVPEHKLAEAMQQIQQLAVNVISKQINAQDVTTDYIDLQARLNVAEAGEQQYLHILKRAQKVTETLAVMQQLNRIRSEIESLKGRLQLLKNQTSLSMITIDITPVYQAQPVAQWQLTEQARLAGQKLIATLKQGIEASIWLVMYVLPLALILLAIAYLSWKFIKRAFN